MNSLSKYNLNKMGANGQMRFQLGSIDTYIIGGPYVNKPKGMAGVKMAEEINAPCLIDVPTKDFGVPRTATVQQALIKAIMVLALGKPLYVGCMGGIGRTGLFLAALAKVMQQYNSETGGDTIEAPASYVRKNYYFTAIETAEQMNWVNDLDVRYVVTWWQATEIGLHSDAKPVVNWQKEIKNYVEGEVSAVLDEVTLEDRVSRLEQKLKGVSRRVNVLDKRTNGCEFTN